MAQVFLLVAFPWISSGANITLKIGDAAPPLKIGQWYKGEPIQEFEAGKLYVVEFWSTWCTPCYHNIPHLSRMAREFAAQATVISVSIWEYENSEAKRLNRVADFVREFGSKMHFRVAADTANSFMGQHWMMAAGQDAIPTAFIVDRDGTIAWIGSPTGNLRDQLKTMTAEAPPTTVSTTRLPAPGID